MAYTGGKSSLARILGAIGRHILPKADDTYDAGSETKRWRTLYAVIAILTTLMIGNIYLQEDVAGRLHINGSLYVNGSLDVRDNFSIADGVSHLNNVLNVSNHSIILVRNMTMYSSDGVLWDCIVNKSGTILCT